VILIDADVLGRARTGDETYVTNLLAELPAAAPDLQFAAVTRYPGLVPAGVEAIELPASLQEVRMAWSLPRLLRRLKPATGRRSSASSRAPRAAPTTCSPSRSGRSETSSSCTASRPRG
jgi:D-serine deaminase-like pyridoxal phosphate-dependent protein